MYYFGILYVKVKKIVYYPINIELLTLYIV